LRNVKCPKKRSCYKGPKPRMGCLKDRDEIPDITRVFDGFKWDVLETEKCGKFRQHPMQGPDWFRYSLSSPKWYYARLNKNGIGERNCRLENSDKVMPYDTLHTMLGIAKDNLAGRCVNRDETFVTSGLVPLATIPGLCVDARGNCQCYDGRQAPRMATLNSAWTFYKMASSLMSGIHIIDELVCYNSPTFSCVLRIWEDWAAEKNGRQATYTKNTRKSTRKKNILEDESQKPKLYTLKDREAIWAQLPEGTQKVLQNQWDKCKKYGEAGEDPLTLDDPNAFKAFDDDVTDPPQHSESMLGESEQWGRMIAHQVSRAKKSSPGMVAGVIKKRVTGRLKSGASSLAKKAVMTAVRKYLPHIFHMTAEQILYHGAKVGDALKNLFVNPKFKRWAIAKIKPFLKRFKITSVEDLLGLWCYQEKCENKLGMSASYGWATSEKAIRDWRRPYTGVYSRLVRKAMELTDSRNNGVINLLAKTCNSIKTVSGKETPHDFSRAAYEQASMAYPVMDTAQLVQNFKHKKHSKEQSKLKVYVIKALPKFWRRVASAIQPLTNPKSGILEHRIEELDAPSFSCYPDMYKEVVSYLFKPFSMKKPFKQFTTATEYVSLPNRTIHWGCPDAIPKVDTTDPNNPVLSWISSGKVDDLISGYHKKFPEFEPLSMPPVKGQVLCKDDGAGKCAKDIGVQCVVEITQQLSTCDTCCCKDGLVKTSMESNLIYGEKNMCAGYFAGIDSAMRIYAGMSRLSVTATSTKDICMDHKLLALSNAEVCQRFKCNKDVLQTFPEDPQKAHKIPPYELDKLCRDTVCGK